MSPDLTGYRIDLTASESTSPSPMIIVSSNNQTFGVILPFMRHLVSGFFPGRETCILYAIAGGNARGIDVP